METAYRTTPSYQSWTALWSLYLITTSISQLTNNHSQRLKHLGHRPSTQSKIIRFQQLERKRGKEKEKGKKIKASSNSLKLENRTKEIKKRETIERETG